MAKTREEHLQWCKDRAMEHWRAGELEEACVSMIRDLDDHPETKGTHNDFILSLGVIYVTNHDHEGMRRWIEGFR